MSKIETELAEAARRLLYLQVADLSELAEAKAALKAALDAHDGMLIDRAAFRTRLPDEKLKELFEEEYQRAEAASPESMPYCPHILDAAAFAAMRRLADYSAHLHNVMVRLAETIQLQNLVWIVAEAERVKAQRETRNWEAPEVKAIGEVVAEILSEVNASEKPAAPVAEPPGDS